MSKPKFSMTAYTGAEIDAAWWGKLIIAVAGIQTASPMPALRQHDHTRPAGVIDSTTTKGGRLEAGGFFLESTEDGRQVLALAREGFPWQASIGVWPRVVEEVKEGATVLVNGRKFNGPGVVWRESLVREISFVSLGADAATNVSVLARAQGGRIESMSSQALGPKTFDLAVNEMLLAGCDPRQAIEAAKEKWPQLYQSYENEIRRGDYGGHHHKDRA